LKRTSPSWKAAKPFLVDGVDRQAKHVAVEGNQTVQVVSPDRDADDGVDHEELSVTGAAGSAPPVEVDALPHHLEVGLAGNFVPEP
jgi:hypothetical protein